MFQLVKVHHCPILIILDEMDAFAGSSAQLDVASNTVERSSDRQLLLYHILDTRQHSWFVGMFHRDHLASSSHQFTGEARPKSGRGNLEDFYSKSPCIAICID
jgi:hypothetical protein